MAHSVASPQGFARMLYARLGDERHPGWRWDSYLSRPLARLKNRVQALYMGEEAPTRDHDWLCQCQDSGSLRIVGLSSTPKGTETVVTVRFALGRQPPDHVQLVLTKDHGWKISDIIDAHGMYYTTALAHDIDRAH